MELSEFERHAARRHRLRLPATYLCWLVVFLFLLEPGLAAQTASTIEGIVRDKQALPVAGVQVRVTSGELAIDRSVPTGSDGSYRVAALPPGDYEIRTSRDGLQSQVFKKLEVTLNRTLTFDITMQVGNLNQAVEVNSTTPLLDDNLLDWEHHPSAADRRDADQRTQLFGLVAARTGSGYQPAAGSFT